MFTVEQREAARDRVLQMARDDSRVVAAAVVGSLAVGGGDRFSDLDLTVGVAEGVPLADVLNDWTDAVVRELEAVHLVDLWDGSTVYRVFLLPGALQFDLSMTPSADFRPMSPRFQLVFGETAAREVVGHAHARAGSLDIPIPMIPRDIFGWGVVYAVHGRSCIERGRVWQAEHYVGAVRDHALALACLREGLPASEARGFDGLSPETLDRFDGAHIGALEPAALRAALAIAVRGLLREGNEAHLPDAEAVTKSLAEVG